jgi:hypothetical protein
MLVVMYAVIRDDRVRRWGWRWERMLLVHEGMHSDEDNSSDDGAVCQTLSSAPRLSRSQWMSWSGLLLKPNTTPPHVFLVRPGHRITQ